MAQLLYFNAVRHTSPLFVCGGVFRLPMEERMSDELNRKTPAERAEDTRRAIVWYRRNRLISQVKMAAALGVSRLLYNRIEVGRRDVTVGELEKIAETLGVDVMELIRPDEVA